MVSRLLSGVRHDGKANNSSRHVRRRRLRGYGLPRAKGARSSSCGSSTGGCTGSERPSRRPRRRSMQYRVKRIVRRRYGCRRCLPKRPAAAGEGFWSLTMYWGTPRGACSSSLSCYWRSRGKACSPFFSQRRNQKVLALSPTTPPIG
jgi:hypothetical protein